MTVVAQGVVVGTVALTTYAYAGYPVLLRLLGRKGAERPRPTAEEWPYVSITVPAYNEEDQIGQTLESLLALDYPVERRQILVVSDASTDRTDEIVKSFAGRGVELLRAPIRSGKTAAENLASLHLRGELVLNTDASVRIRRDALKKLAEQFDDPAVGVASARDISISHPEDDSNQGEAGYVGYEMKVRELETGFYGIVGASGCCYMIRLHLHRLPLPDALSRDFAAALKAREHGFRSVSVSDAICYVPRTSSLHREYHRKVRTITRGMETLIFKRHLLNPFRFGRFAFMLWSHKVARWLIPWSGAIAFVSVGLLASTSAWAAAVFALGSLALVAGLVGWKWEDRPIVARWLRVPAFALMGNIAAMHAGIRAVHGDRDPTWEPTRRKPVEAGAREVGAA